MNLPDKKEERSFGMCMDLRPPGFVIPCQPQNIARRNNASSILPLQKFACHWSTCGAVFNTLEDFEIYFAQFYSYVSHIHNHASHTLHACFVPGCGRRYRSIDNLRNHMVTHALSKTIPCLIVGCNRTLERGRRVSRSHFNVKPFMCPMLNCRKRYSDSTSLTKHLKGFHGESAYAVFRELKKSVPLWERNFRVQSNSEGNVHVVGVNGEEINFEEMINHIFDISEAEVMHHQNIGDLANIAYNYDVKTPPMFYPYAPPTSFYQMPPMFVYPISGQQSTQEKGGTSLSKPLPPSTEQQQSISTGQIFPLMGYPAFAPLQPGPSNSQKPSSPISVQQMYPTVLMMPYFQSMPGMFAAYGCSPNSWVYQMNEEDEGHADYRKPVWKEKSDDSEQEAVEKQEDDNNVKMKRTQRRNSIFPRQAIKRISVIVEEAEVSTSEDILETDDLKNDNADVAVLPEAVDDQPKSKCSQKVVSKSQKKKEKTISEKQFKKRTLAEQNEGTGNEVDDEPIASVPYRFVSEGKVLVSMVLPKEKNGKRKKVPRIPQTIEIHPTLLKEPRASCIKKKEGERDWSYEKRFRWADSKDEAKLEQVKKFNNEYNLRQSTYKKSFFNVPE